MDSARYSSASSPTAEALMRSGRSLETSVTRLPSLARLRATARMRVSLSPRRKPDGRDAASVWLSSTRMVPPSCPIGDRLVEPAVGDAEVVEHPQRGAGEVAELGVVPLPLQLGDDHDRQHDLVLGEAFRRAGIGEQHAGVEDIGPTGARLSVGRRKSWAMTTCWPRRTPCSGSARALSARPDVIQRTGELLIECTMQAFRCGKLPHLPFARKYARRDAVSGRHARTWGEERATGLRTPKRRSRSAYARIARRKSTRRKSGQRASQK